MSNRYVKAAKQREAYCRQLWQYAERNGLAAVTTLDMIAAWGAVGDRALATVHKRYKGLQEKGLKLPPYKKRRSVRPRFSMDHVRLKNERHDDHHTRYPAGLQVLRVTPLGNGQARYLLR